MNDRSRSILNIRRSFLGYGVHFLLLSLRPTEVFRYPAPERNNEILFQPLTKETIRSVPGLLASKTLVTKELLRERAKDREHEGPKLGKRRTR